MVGDAPTPEGWEVAFARTLETQIVPQLLTLRAARTSADAPATDAEVAVLADRAVDQDTDAALDCVRKFSERTSYPNALLNLAAPAARRLGLDWEDDRRDFLDVTIGLGVLQRVIAELSGDFLATPLPDRRILLGPTPGEHHTFGLALVDTFFRMARWDVDFRPTADRAELVAAVGAEAYSVLGLSLSRDTLVDEAAVTVRLARAASLNPSIRVLVGGPALLRQKALATTIGADAVARDGREATQIASAWVATGELEQPA